MCADELYEYPQTEAEKAQVRLDQGATAADASSSGHPGREIAVAREQALFNFYSAERRAGADPLLANERMHFFAKRLDRAAEQVADDAFSRDLAVIRSCMERRS